MQNKLIQTTYRQDGSVLHEFRLGEADWQVYVLMPRTELPVNLINYGFTGPTLLVFPERKLAPDELEAYARDCGLLTVAKANGMGILFVNPHGDNWAGEPAGAYEAVAANLAIAQSNFRDGLVILKDEAVPDEVNYKILGATVRMYVYGLGTGADYVGAHYLKPVQASAVLGDLGRAVLTPVCCTLVWATALPKPEKNDITVVSVKNSAACNALLEESCRVVTVRDDVDFHRDFVETVGNVRRWGGKIVPAYNYEAEGIVDRAESVMVPISPDNQVFARRMRFRPAADHKVGYVCFYDKDLDVKHGNVPLMLVFHGGGDSAYATTSLAEWPEIGQKEGFITVAVEMHMAVSAKEVAALIDHLCGEFSIDRQRIYATGFSMGGIKSWDLFEQCPELFAALLPMDAIDYVGNNCFGGKTAPEDINRTVPVPLFYVGGVDSFGVELPCHHERAVARLKYLAEVNRFKNGFAVDFAQKDKWTDPLYGVPGDRTEVLHDPAFPESEYFVHYFDSADGSCYTCLLGVTHHAHEIRPFTNRFAWNFVKKFRRTPEGIRIVEEQA